ncbi:MAG: protein BatD [Spartobacteria bacterium]|nr:protein BatD [Spartobacteria bacterium]
MQCDRMNNPLIAQIAKSKRSNDWNVLKQKFQSLELLRRALRGKFQSLELFKTKVPIIGTFQKARVSPLHACCGLAFLFLLLSSSGVLAAFTAEMDLQPRTLRVGEPAKLTITIRGMNNPPAPSIKAIDGLQIHGPSMGTTMNMQIINGRQSIDRATILTYSVVPLKGGEYTIGPYAYMVDNQSVKLPAIQLSVVDDQGGNAAASSSQAIFAELSTSTDNIYTSEIFDLVVSIYHRDNIGIGRDISLLNFSTAGLSLQPFEELQAQRVAKDNIIYNVRRFRCKAYALTAGQFQLNPTLRVPVMMPRERRQRHSFFDDPFADLFGSTPTQPVDITPEPLDINVQSLPTKNKPADFSGAVGQYLLAVDVRPAELDAGDPVTINVVISGKGNFETVNSPKFADNVQFKAYEARRLESDFKPEQGIGRKVFEQVVIPKDENVKEIPAIHFSFFNPVQGTYQTITKGPFPITVHATEKSAGAQVLTPDLKGTEEQAKILGTDLVYLRPPPAVWTKNKPVPFYRKMWFLVVPILPPLLVFITWLLQRRRHELTTNVAKARRLKAPRAAQEGIKAARHAIHSKDMPAFYNGLWMALSSYFGHRLNLSPGEINSELVIEHCKQAKADDVTIQNLANLFALCDQGRFGMGRSLSEKEQRDKISELTNILKNAERISL